MKRWCGKDVSVTEWVSGGGYVCVCVASVSVDYKRGDYLLHFAEKWKRWKRNKICKRIVPNHSQLVDAKRKGEERRCHNRQVMYTLVASKRHTTLCATVCTMLKVTFKLFKLQFRWSNSVCTPNCRTAPSKKGKMLQRERKPKIWRYRERRRWQWWLQWVRMRIRAPLSSGVMSETKLSKSATTVAAVLSAMGVDGMGRGWRHLTISSLDLLRQHQERKRGHQEE